MSESKKRIEWIELAQILSMLLVVFHHSMPNYTNFNSALVALGSTVHFPALSLFFFCSGFFATGWIKSGYKKYIKSRAVRLIIPWIVISLLMLLPKALFASAETRISLLSLRGLGWVLIDPHGRGVLPHLWYLPALFIISLFVPLIEKAVKNRTTITILLLMAFVAACIPNDVTTILCLNEIRMYLVWFLVGYFIHSARGVLKFRKGFKLVLVAVLFTTATLIVIFVARELVFARIIITTTGIVSILSIAILAEKRMKPVIVFFRGKTLCVYLWSLCAQNFVEVIAEKIGLNGNLAFMLMFITGIVVPLTIYKIVVWVEKKSNRNLKTIRIALGI